MTSADEATVAGRGDAGASTTMLTGADDVARADAGPGSATVTSAAPSASVPPPAPRSAAGTPLAPPPVPTGGAGPFVTEPPPWGASAYESNPEAGAGAFGTDRSTRPPP